MPLNLSELFVLVQDQIQKSFEFSEHMAVIGRDSDQSDVRLSLSEAEIDLPVTFKTDDATLDVRDLKRLVESGQSIEISNALLNLPTVDKSFEFALKDRMTLNKVETKSREAEMAENVKLEKDNDGSRLIEMMTEIHAKRVENLSWESLSKQKFVSLKVATLSASELSSEKGEQISGRLALKFKTVLK